MNNRYESMGEHIRNKLSHYEMLLTLIKDLKKSEHNIEQFNKTKNLLYNAVSIEPLEELVRISKMNEIESIKWIRKQYDRKTKV